MKYILIILFIFSALESFSQTKDQELFNDGIKQYSIDKLESINTFKKLIKKYPKSKFYSISIYNLGQIYNTLDSIEQSIQWFEYAIVAKFKDNMDWYNFPDTHSNIKHKSSHDLGHIYYKLEDYHKALDYYFKALNDYPYYSTSGTSTKKNNIKIRRWISDSYLNINDTVKAINVLIPDAITATPWFENPVSKDVLELIIDYYGKDIFLIRFNNALNSLKKNKNYFSMILYEDEIHIYPYGSRMKDWSLESYIQAVKEREFYISLNN